ncbi:MAG: threonylcarbamoyl-AMP synthase [Eubacterium sp.]|nr:threonylcarbamoyl-AMP synthase [Eubacterium sp.]
METILETIDPVNPEADVIRRAAEFIKNGDLVAFPTETVYGLGADALRPEASQKIYAAKGRPSDNPLIVHIAQIEDLYRIADPVPEEALLLAKRFWPGPLTMILHKKECVPKQTTGGLNTVAIRFPSHPVARELIRQSGCLIAAPSANTSGRPSPTCAEHVHRDLDGRIAMILDGGEVGLGLESTIIDLSVDRPAVLRPGFITAEMLKEVLGDVDGEKPFAETGHEDSHAPKAPGMKYTHYAPKAPMTLVRGEQEAVIRTIRQLAAKHREKGERIGILCSDETAGSYEDGLIKSIGSRAAEAEIAHNLYRVLREFDEQDLDAIYSEMFDTAGVGQAIMNRMLKAAGHRILDAD